MRLGRKGKLATETAILLNLLKETVSYICMMGEGCFTAWFCFQNETDHYLKLQTMQKHRKVQVLSNPRV